MGLRSLVFGLFALEACNKSVTNLVSAFYGHVMSLEQPYDKLSVRVLWAWHDAATMFSINL